MIFLDIDGVLRIDTIDHPKILRPKLVNNIRKLANILQQKIVLSSAWRYGNMKKGHSLHQAFCEAKAEDIYKLIVDRTPLASEVAAGNKGAQIEAWIYENDYSNPFIIIDDVDEVEPYSNNLVLVDPTKGFVKDYIEHSVKIFTNQKQMGK